MSATRWRWWWRKRAAAAQDAAELVQVDYEELPPVVDLETAMKRQDATLSRSARQSLRRLAGPGAERAERARGRRDHRQGAACGARERHQSAHGGGLAGNARRHRRLRRGERQLHAARLLAERRFAARPGASIMGVPNEKLRVITDDVGGAFGMKTTVYPEYPALLVAARKLGRPVHWQSTRSEAFVSDARRATPSPRPNWRSTTRASSSPCACGICATRAPMCANAGININTNNFARCLPGMYRIPKVDVGVACYFSNRVPIGALSRRRTAGGELRARARGRGSRARHRHRPGAAAQEEPHSAVGDAVQDADQHLRQRRFPRHRRQGARARRLRQFQQAQARSGAAQETTAASASPACWSIPARCRWRRPRSRFPAATS